MIILEFCNGGTLRERILAAKKAKTAIPAEEIWKAFIQMLLAMQYVHASKVLHRDMKSENIMLHEGHCKLADFGLARQLTSQSRMAKTAVGTPYYISPEVCEGKLYDQKTDVWSLGCIVYEMIAYHPPFLAKNLCALVMKITCDPAPPLPEGTDSDLLLAIEKMLEKNAKLRPSVDEILQWDCITSRLPTVLKDFPTVRPLPDGMATKGAAAAVTPGHTLASLRPADAEADHVEEEYEDDFEEVTAEELLAASDTTLLARSKALAGSVPILYYVGPGNVLQPTGGHFLHPTMGMHFVSMAVGGTEHGAFFGAVTTDGMLYSWGTGSRGQLGHGSSFDYEAPYLCLAGAAEVAAGDEFMLALTQNYEVYSAGAGTEGQCGRCVTTDQHVFEMIETLKNITHIACGARHALALDEDGVVWSWGAGKTGQLGHGEAKNLAVPTKVRAFDGIPVRHIACGPDYSACVSDDGVLYVWGNNSKRQLGLPSSAADKVLLPTAHDMLSGIGVDRIACGARHGVVLTTSQRVYCWGSNESGQLGTSDCVWSQLAEPEAIGENQFVDVACGARHTLAVTTDGHCFAWGSGDSDKFDKSFRSAVSSDGDVHVPATLAKLADHQVDHVASHQYHSVVLVTLGHGDAAQ